MKKSTLTFRPYRLYFFPANKELLYQVVGTTNLGYVATLWRRGYSGRPYMLDVEPVLLTEAARQDMRELGFRLVEPRTEAGTFMDPILHRQHWYTFGPRYGNC